MNRLKAFCILLIFLAFLAQATFAADISPAALSAKEEKIPVIIRFHDQPQGKYTSLQGMTAALKQQYAGDEFIEKKVYREMNAVSGFVTKAALEKMAKNPGIRSIDYNPPVYPTLAQSVPLINGTLAQNALANGSRVNGQGETICIIDTGINYTHPDLGGCAQAAFLNGTCAKVIGGHNYCADEGCSTENENSNDAEGHGTHVAGIAAANGSLTGVAPGAKIVSIRVFNSTGGAGDFANVEAGVRWCTNNATRFNITVISMSLGSSLLYNANCDSSYSSLADAINNATLHNIAVIASSGNNANTTHIASPACIRNATAAGATYDANIGSTSFSACTDSTTSADKIACYSNRGALVSLMAPGSAITSASVSGGNVTQHGTSMAAPHVAGAYALVRAYERLESGTNMTPAAIFSALNSTGTRVNDSSRNYSRINILAAIASIDNTLPSVNITSPANATHNSANITLNFTISDNVATGSCWYINETGGNVSLTGCGNITFTGVEGNNNISVFVNDTNGNTNITQRFFRIDTTAPQVAVQSPGNTTFTTNNATLNFTASDAAISSCFYSLNGAANATLAACGNITLIVASGENNIVVYANDTAGNLNSSQTYFTTNITVPIISAQSPTNSTYNATNITLNYTIAGSTDRCWFLNATGSNVFLNAASGAACGNITFLSREGYNNITIFANNSLGNSSNVSLFFTADTILPQITFAAPTPNNEVFSTTFSAVINVTINDNVSSARLLFNGTTYNLSLSGPSWSVRIENLTDGNYSFNVTANDTANNTNISATRWVFINVTRNVANFTANLTSALSQNNVSYFIFNDTGTVTNNLVDVVNNYTIRFNISGRFADIVNFTWLNANTTAVINASSNVTTINITAAFNSSGGVLDSVIWIDMNNFTSNFTPRAVFGTSARIFYYINGSRTEPSYTRITAQCDANRTTVPCYELNNTNSLVYLSNFSGAAAGNDTQAPNASVTSPTATTYDTTNITLNYAIADNVAADKCWYALNSGGNTSLASCGNITFTAAEGTNRLYLYTNDTSGNQNSTNVNFTVTLPQASSGGGGGGGGGGAAAPANPNKRNYLFSGTGTIKLNVSSNRTALETIYIETARYMPASLSVEALNATNTTPPGILYQALSITARDFTPAFVSATIQFRVPKQWITGNSINHTTVRLYRQAENGTWAALETSVARDDIVSYAYSAVTANFSAFAIAGERTAQEAQQQQKSNQTEKICIQVITPATNGTHCINYPTPCDVPEGWTKAQWCPSGEQPKPGQDSGYISGFAQDSIIPAAVAVAAILMILAILLKGHKKGKGRKKT